MPLQAQKVYVQDRLRESGKLVWQLLQEGAHFYVCGDAAHMAGSVEQALLHIIQHHQVWPATVCTSPFSALCTSSKGYKGYGDTYLSSYIHSAWSVWCALLSRHIIILSKHRTQHLAEAFHGLTVSILCGFKFFSSMSYCARQWCHTSLAVCSGRRGYTERRAVLGGFATTGVLPEGCLVLRHTTL